MCGFVGIVHRGQSQIREGQLKAMAEAIRHRGPDDEGYWQDSDVALGFVRLSIVDLEHGAQPMTNEDDQVVVVYNGEIYNHVELRRELEACGHRFRTDHCDTEVLVHGYEQWGTDLLPRLNGMFAFALWDRTQRTLLLARDRYGIKPLYVAEPEAGVLVFASEIRGLHASGLVTKRENPQGLLEYLSLQNLTGEQTMFAGVRQFPAGSWMKQTPQGDETRRYWDYRFTRSRRLSLGEAADAHREILERVVKRQMAADVPVQAYLSGGIDSSAIVCAAHRLDPNLRGYSCLFDLTGVEEDRIVDERDYSRTVAQRYGIRHIEMELPQDSLTSCLDEVVTALEDLRMGMSYVNYLIAGRVAHDGKVVLSGLGGDELHGGYLYRYQAVRPQADHASGLMNRLKRLLRGYPSQGTALDTYRNMLNFPIPLDQLDNALTPEFLAAAQGFDARQALDDQLAECPPGDIWDTVMYHDARNYMHGLLVMEDKLSMIHSLETRVPLLDNELVDFVSDLPWDLLCDGHTGKIVFRESVRPWVPEAIYSKPKMGFGPPDASWYRGALRPFIERELCERRVRARGIFQPDFVRQTLEDHFSRKANNLPKIWSLLCVESWCRSNDLYGGALQ